MKKISAVLSITLAILILLTCVPIAFSVSDEATIPDGFKPIYSIEDLYCVRYDLSSNYILMNDIDLTEATATDGDWSYDGRGWNPIGSDDVYGNGTFSGVFDGNGFSIIGLTINISSYPSGTDKVYIGLFSKISGTVKNLSISGSFNVRHTFDENLYIGSIAGMSSGAHIINCRSNTAISSTVYSYKYPYSYVGGIVGYNSGNINKCSNNSDLSTRGSGRCYCHLGGIAGFSSGKQIWECTNKGNLFGSDSTTEISDFCDVGGITCAVSPTVTVSSCYNTGNITLSGDFSFAAGIVDLSFPESTNSSSVNVYYCYNAGSIGIINNGGFAICEKESTKCYYLKGSGKDSTGATALTDSQMKLQSMYNGLNFNSIWCFDNTSDYPYPVLQFEVECIHEQTTLNNRVEPTCTETGYSGDEICDNCGFVVSQGSIISATGHDRGRSVIENKVSATCTELGSYDEVIYCTKCNEELSRTTHEISVAPHVPGKSIKENMIGTLCTEDRSYDEVVYCINCGAELSRERVELSAVGHTEVVYEQEATCADSGYRITICTRCGETLSKEILPRLEHTWTSEVTQNPTCTAQGVKTYTCESCGETYTEPVDVLAHQWDDGKMTKEPSCTEAGEMTYTCATGGETRTEPIDKLDHEIVLIAGKAASCTEPGLTDGWQCKNCKKWFAEQQTIPALDHDPQIGKVVEPTCEEPGYTPFICTRCGETVSKTDPTDALGHNMQPTYVWAKDDTTVTATMVCTRCDKTGATETAEVKTEITVKPTCSTEGELTLTAAFNNKSFYGQTKTKTLPRDPNAHVFKVTVTPPTCLDDGYTTHACTLCRYGYSDEIVPALGHKPVTDEAVPATCEAPGLTEGSHCSVCGGVLTAQEETPLADHTDADNDGKCDMCGDQMRGGSHCKYCGKIHGGAFGWLTKLIHSILAIFKR